jgi:hypothetical protein
VLVKKDFREAKWLVFNREERPQRLRPAQIDPVSGAAIAFPGAEKSARSCPWRSIGMQDLSS